MYKHCREVEFGTTEKQFQLVARAGFELGATELKSRALNHSAMLPPCFFAHRYNSAKVKPLKTNGCVIDFKSTYYTRS